MNATSVYTTQGRRLALSDELGAGGQGAIFRTDYAGRVAKLYDPPGRAPEEKLRAMLLNRPSDPTRSASSSTPNHRSIAWPEKLLYADPEARNPVGYLMPEIEDAAPIPRIASPLKRQQEDYEWDWDHAHHVGMNLASAVGAIHEAGHVIGDLNSRNVLVADDCLVTLIDTDSFQIHRPSDGRTFPCPVINWEFAAPEISRAGGPANMELEPAQDRFALGILIYYLLFGHHPYSGGRWTGGGDPPKAPELIRKAQWTWDPDSDVEPVPRLVPFDAADDTLRGYFRRCFEAGHGDPSARPSAREWRQALMRASENLAHCPKSEWHRYPESKSSCPWCEYRSEVGTEIWGPGEGDSGPSRKPGWTPGRQKPKRRKPGPTPRSRTRRSRRSPGPMRLAGFSVGPPPRQRGSNIFTAAQRHFFRPLMTSLDVIVHLTRRHPRLVLAGLVAAILTVAVFPGTIAVLLTLAVAFVVWHLYVDRGYAKGSVALSVLVVMMVAVGSSGVRSAGAALQVPVESIGDGAARVVDGLSGLVPSPTSSVASDPDGTEIQPPSTDSDASGEGEGAVGGESDGGAGETSGGNSPNGDPPAGGEGQPTVETGDQGGTAAPAGPERRIRRARDLDSVAHVHYEDGDYLAAAENVDSALALLEGPDGSGRLARRLAAFRDTLVRACRTERKLIRDPDERPSSCPND